MASGWTDSLEMEITMYRAIGYRALTCGWLLAVGAVTTVASAQGAPAQTRPLPTELADSTFWRLVNTFSEGEQPFQAYLVSNEQNYPNLVRQVIDLFPQTGAPRGAYIGVAPEQNYHYIAALRPQIAFILDIRRQAVMQHLVFKTVFELSPTRADFISMLFVKPKPAGISDTLGAFQTWDAFWHINTDTSRYRATLTRMLDHLTKTHRFALTREDSSLIEFSFGAFYWAGPNLMANGSSGPPTNNATFANITSNKDFAGVERSFLANNANYQIVRAMHLKNLVIPIVGDFAGTHALRSIGNYLREHGTTVTAFYVSNVEDYLGRAGNQPAFGANVAALPTNAQSVLLRGSGGSWHCNIQRFVASGYTLLRQC
jgi:hypothetical protein